MVTYWTINVYLALGASLTLTTLPACSSSSSNANSSTGGSPANGGASAGGGGSAVTGGQGTTGTTGVGGTTGAAGGSAVACPSTVLKSGTSSQSVTVGSLNRTYVLRVPSGYTGTKAVPLVIDYHPLGGTGSGWLGSGYWTSTADSNGFIMAYPDSYSSNDSWNVGMCCEDAQHNSIDDVAFTRAMVKQIEGLACVDPKRVYATGCSNGGGMSFKIACDAADIIAAAAPVDFECVYGGTTSNTSCTGCQPSRPISITQFTNTGDTALVPYNGGMTTFAADCPPGQSCTGMEFPSAQSNFSTWQQIDACTGSTTTLSGYSACTTNATCGDSAQVSLCVQQGGSHCGNYGTLNIVAIAWSMFQKE